MKKKHKKIALVLGGGAIFGSAHIGVLKAFEDSQLKIDHLSATGLGAFVAALFACGINTEDLTGFIQKLHWLDMYEFTLSGLGKLSNIKIAETLENAVSVKNMKDSNIALTFVATDINDGSKVILREADLGPAVMACTSIPGVFLPVDIGGRMLVDGSIVENIPVSPLQELETYAIVGVDLISRRHYNQPKNLIEVLCNAFDIAARESLKSSSCKIDFMIKPELRVQSNDESINIRTAIRNGYEAAIPVVEEIKNQQQKTTKE